MPDLIDPADLIGVHEVAHMLGLSQRSSVATYRKRHHDFPTPTITTNNGRCLLWLRSDVAAWASGRKPNPTPTPQQPHKTTETDTKR